MHQIRNIGRLLLAVCLYIINIPKGIFLWWKELIFIRNTIGFGISTGLFSFLCGLFLSIQLLFIHDGGITTTAEIALFWGLFACISGAVQLYSISVNNLKSRQVSSIIQLLMYMFFLSLTILSGGSLLLIAILLTQIILLTVSAIRITQELRSNGY